MIKEQTLMKLIDSEDNIINLEEARKALMTGGSNGDENWLKNLSVGTVFLCRPKNRPKDVLAFDLFCVLDHKEKHSNLMQKIPDGRQADFWFNTLEFSRSNNFGEIIAEVKLGYADEAPGEEQETPETTDGNSSGPV